MMTVKLYDILFPRHDCPGAQAPIFYSENAFT